MKRPALPDAVSWAGPPCGTVPFSCLIFDPVSSRATVAFPRAEPAFARAANTSQTGGEGYFPDLAHKIATRGRQAAHRGALSSVTSPEPAVLFLLLYRETASQSPGPVMLLQKSVPSHPSECLISVLHGRPQ